MSKKSLSRLIAVLSVGLLSTSTASILIRFAQHDQVPSPVIAAYRLGLATLILTPIVLQRHRSELRRLTRRDVWIALASGAFLALHFATWISSLDYTTVTSSIVLVATNPIWVALASWLFLRERLSRPIVIGLIITIAGGFVVGFSDACDPASATCEGLASGGSQLWGDALALLGAWFGAGYLLIGRYLRDRMSLLVYIYLVYGTAAVVLIGVVVLTGRSFVADGAGQLFPARAYLWLISLAIFPQLVGHSSLNYALRFLPSTYVAIVTLAEPIGTSILAFLLLNELPAALTIVGAAIILGGIAIASLSARTVAVEIG